MSGRANVLSPLKLYQFVVVVIRLDEI